MLSNCYIVRYIFIETFVCRGFFYLQCEGFKRRQMNAAANLNSVCNSFISSGFNLRWELKINKLCKLLKVCCYNSSIGRFSFFSCKSMSNSLTMHSVLSLKNILLVPLYIHLWFYETDCLTFCIGSMPTFYLL